MGSRDTGLDPAVNVAAKTRALPGPMAEWLRRGLQILARRFDSGSGLHLLSGIFGRRADAEDQRAIVVHDRAAGHEPVVQPHIRSLEFRVGLIRGFGHVGVELLAALPL